MKNDDFENQLQRLQMRKIPADWRAQILGTAGQSISVAPAKEAPKSRGSWWRDLLWPCPQAWAAFACVWIGIIFSEMVETPPSSKQSQAATAPATPKSMQMWIAERRTINGNNGTFGL